MLFILQTKNLLNGKSLIQSNQIIWFEYNLVLGIDHFLALECFDAVHTGGGKIESFVSFCGGNYDY